MPAGEIHFQYFKRGYYFVVPSSVLLSLWDVKFAIGNLVGYSLGRWIDPDWDLMGTNNGEGRMVNELPAVGHYLYGKSSMYGSIFRKWHRSFITHFPGISTSIRLAFVGYEPFFVGDFVGINFLGGGWHMFWLGLWFGLSQADGIHYWLDKTYGDS